MREIFRIKERLYSVEVAVSQVVTGQLVALRVCGSISKPDCVGRTEAWRSKINSTCISGKTEQSVSHM